MQPNSSLKKTLYEKSMLLSSAERPYMIGQGQAGERVSFIASKSDYSPLTREIIGLKNVEKPVSSSVGGPRGDFAHVVDQHYAIK